LAHQAFLVRHFNKDLVLDPSAQNLFADRMNATKTVIEGGHDTLIAFPKQVAAVIEAAAGGAHKRQTATSSN
jgi:hypothetical protein